MEITLDSLIRDVQALTPDTLVQLEVASQRAGDLADLGDSLLNHFVDRCRKGGHTWAEIGQHLGVSRQAVQKRFVPGAGFDRFTDRARLAVVNARAAATTLQHSYVGTEHQLLGLFDTGGGISDLVLADLGITADDIVDDVVGVVGRGPTPVAGDQSFTPRAVKVFEESLQVSLELHHNYIGTEHLLLALFRGQDGLAKRFLEQRGATQEIVRQKVVERLAELR